jgi:hypothetical protein
MENRRIARVVTESFSALSRIRGKRVFHPHGVGFGASLTSLGGPPTGSVLFDREEPRSAIVRLSRSIGLPESLADPCGLAFRVPDAYGRDEPQDLLLVSSGARPLVRHLISPARGFADRLYSTLLPYRLNGALQIIGAVATSGGPGPKLAKLARRHRGGMTFRILLATPRGKWRPVASLELEERLPDDEIDDLQLDPANSGGGLELAGFLNRLRHPAYRGSQAGRGALGSPEPA